MYIKKNKFNENTFSSCMTKLNVDSGNISSRQDIIHEKNRYPKITTTNI
jgi:hypothetical protein